MTGNNNKGLYKKYQCRYFNDDGSPTSPSCREKDMCRFVHPTDANWPGRKYAVQPKAYPANNNPNGNNDAPSSPPRARYGPPLPPQGDLFRSCKEEDSEDQAVLDLSVPRREPNRAGDRDCQSSRAGSTSREMNKPNNRRLAERVESVEKPKPEYASKRVATPATGVSNGFVNESVLTMLTAQAAGLPMSHEASTKMVELFRSLAKVSSSVLEMTSEYDRQEKKLETYTEISATLSKVSTSAAAAVAPNLAEIILQHAHTQNNLEQGLNAIGQVWQEIFLAVTKEVGSVINTTLQQAVVTLKTEAGAAVNAAIARAPGLKASRSSGSHSESSKRHRDDDDHERSWEKRRRVDDHDSSRRRPSTDDLLQEMKSKLEQQMTSISVLTKENNELKSMLNPKPIPTAPRESFFQSNEGWANRPSGPRAETGDKIDGTPRRLSNASESYSRHASSRRTSEHVTGGNNRGYSPRRSVSHDHGKR